MAESHANYAESEPNTCDQVLTFFKNSGLLKKSCEETGLDYTNVNRNLNGSAAKIKFLYITILFEWMTLWMAQEAERKALSAKVKEITHGHD